MQKTRKQINIYNKTKKQRLQMIKKQHRRTKKGGKGREREEKKEREKEKEKTNKKTIIGFITVHWCGFCKDLKHTKDYLIKEFEYSTDIHIHDIDGENPRKSKNLHELNMKIHNKQDKIKELGYPTIFKIKNGELSYYNNKYQTYELLKSWILDKPAPIHNQNFAIM
jgi:hypothetical protein